VFRIIAEKTREPLENPVAQVIRREKLIAMEEGALLLARDGSEVPIDDSAAPIKDDLGQVTGAVLVFRDITKHRTLEEHLRATQKLEAIGRLAGGIAHDFNNLMTVALTSCDLLSRNPSLTPDALELVDCIRDAGERATTLTKQLLAYSRKQVLRAQILNLNQLIQEVERLLRRLISESIDLGTVLAPDLRCVKADSGQMQQVLLNLVVNARDAMPDGGRLTLITSNVYLDEEYTHTHPGTMAGPHVRLAVQDTGCGMSEATLTRIFEPFFTTKEVGKGSGLGLATVYGIVKQSGGHVEVFSHPGRGSTFVISLPAVEAGVEDLEPGGYSVELPRGGEVILLVEDEEAVRAVTGQLLQGQGFDVLIAGSPQEALVLAEQMGRPIDLLITDIIMPGMNGRMMAERLLVRFPAMKVLYLSGYNNDVLTRHGIDPGAAFLPKPYPAATLMSKVREILDVEKTQKATG
jgi:signal transduction histidine kinase/ActR/RegA family two-component response regulator